MRLKSLIRRDDVDFREGMIPLLHACSEYLVVIVDLFLRKNGSDVIAQEKKYVLEKMLQIEESGFPEWVYARGFNPTLREGHRHFLIRTEQITQILFAMHHVARKNVDSTLLNDFSEPIHCCVEQVKILISAFILRLELKETGEIASDLSKSVFVLEETFHKIMPLPFELLDLSQDYLSLAAFIYNFKDLQKMLLKLVEALR